MKIKKIPAGLPFAMMLMVLGLFVAHAEKIDSGSGNEIHLPINHAKPMKMKFDMICLFVSDMGAMSRFYVEAMGLEIKEGGTSDSPYTEFTGAGIRFSMYKRDLLPAMLGQAPGYPKGLNGTMELAINVGAKENVDKIYRQMLSQGGTSVYAPRDEPWKMRSSMIADPEGNLVEIGSDFWN